MVVWYEDYVTVRDSSWCAHPSTRPLVPGPALIRMQDELSALFGGHPVDLMPPVSEPAHS